MSQPERQPPSSADSAEVHTPCEREQGPLARSSARVVESAQRDTSYGDEVLRAALLCGVVCCALLLNFTQSSAGPNPASRLATMDALVHDHTFVINNSHFGSTIDRVMVGDKSYSSKPPVYSTLGAGVYWVLRHFTRLNLREEAQRDLTVYVLTLILSGLPVLIMLAYAHRLLRWFALSNGARVWTFACLSLGWLGLGYAVTINNHGPAAATALIAFYYAFGVRHGHLTGRWPWLCAGFFGGLSPTLDLGTMFTSAALGLYLLSFDVRRTFARFVPAALIPVLGHFWLTWYVSGNLLPIYLRRELYDYPGSYWRAPTGIDALNEPRSTYLFNILLGHHGFFSMTPVLILAVIAMVRVLLRRDRRYLAEAWTIGAPLVVLITFYTFTTKNYGGVCVGFRWLLPIAPLVLLFVAVWFSQLRRRVALGVFLVCLLVSQYNAYSALREPWATSDWHRWLTGGT